MKDAQAQLDKQLKQIEAQKQMAVGRLNSYKQAKGYPTAVDQSSSRTERTAHLEDEVKTLNDDNSSLQEKVVQMKKKIAELNETVYKMADNESSQDQVKKFAQLHDEKEKLQKQCME